MWNKIQYVLFILIIKVYAGHGFNKCHDNTFKHSLTPWLISKSNMASTLMLFFLLIP